MKEESLFKTLLDALHDYGVLALDAQGQICFVNRYAEELFALERHCLLGQSIWEIHRFRLRDPEKIKKALKRAQEQGVFRFSFPYVKGEENFLFEAHIYPFKEKDEGFLITFRDVTQELKHKKALRQKERLLEVLARASRLFIEKDWKKAAQRFLDLLQKAGHFRQLILLENTGKEYLFRALSPRLSRRGRLPRCPVNAFSAAEKGKSFFCPLAAWPLKYHSWWEEKRSKYFYTQPIWVNQHLWGLLMVGCKEKGEIEGQEEVFSIAADLIGAAVHRQRLQEQFFQAQKMESICQLAGGLAHNFNNLLTIILGNLERSRKNWGKEVSKYLDEIESCTIRAAELIRQLLIFATPESQGQKEPCRLNEVLTEIEDMIKILASEKITIDLRAENTGEIRANKNIIEQIVLNLVTNARDAMPQGGRLTIHTRNRKLGQEEAKPLGISPGVYACLEVTDTGKGMSEEVKKHIFEAFFSTKDVGQGTGLGLSMVYGAVKHLGGAIEVKSSPGKGTSFYLFFPVTEGKESPPKETEKKKEHKRSRLRILLVEDEDFLREHLADVLRENGHQVFAAKLPQEALELFSAKGPFDLLITDVSLPGSSGKQLAKLFLAHDPDLRVLFISGFPEKLVSPPEGSFFLQKPFKLGEFLSKLDEISFSIPDDLRVQEPTEVEEEQRSLITK